MVLSFIVFALSWDECDCSVHLTYGTQYVTIGYIQTGYIEVAI